MAVTTEDVMEGITQLWAGGGSLPTLRLGKYQDPANVPENPTYTIYTVKDGTKRQLATTDYLQAFTIELQTWDETGAANAGPIKLAIEAAMNVLPLPGQANLTLSLANGRTLKILGCRKADDGGGTLDEDEATQQAQAVKLSTDRFEMLCQS